MSQEHDQSSPTDAPTPEGIHPEAPPFEPGYQPESLPQISVPDLPPDAEGLTAEALSQVPTLTELVGDALVEEEGDGAFVADLAEEQPPAGVDGAQPFAGFLQLPGALAQVLFGGRQLHKSLVNVAGNASPHHLAFGFAQGKDRTDALQNNAGG